MVTVPRIAAVSCLSTIPFLYGIEHADSLRAELLLSDPTETIRRFYDRECDIALIPASATALLEDARIVTEYCVGGVEGMESRLRKSDDPFVEMWKEWGESLPSAFAVWVAHSDVGADDIEALQYALTYGLEHGYEALLASEKVSDFEEAYDRLSEFDYIYDNQKHKALQKFWDSGVKATPRVNPG